MNRNAENPLVENQCMEPDLTFPDPFPLRGRTALVTGSSRGIGMATAEWFVDHGASVVVHGGHDAAQLEHTMAALQNRIESRHRWSESRKNTSGMVPNHPLPDQAVHAYLADLSVASNVKRFCDTVWRETSGISIFVAAAGSDILTRGATQWNFEQRLSALVAVDLMATVRTAREFGCRMAESTTLPTDRSIVLIGWSGVSHGTCGDGGQLFGIAKGAIHGFVPSLARELAPTVRVNGVAPGWIRTAWGEQTSTEWNERIERGTALRRWGTPAETAAAIGMLCSPTAAYITGMILPVDGLAGGN